MADFDFKCSRCKQQIVTDDAYAGESILCPGCGAEITVPSGGKPAAATAPNKARKVVASDSLVWRSSSR